MKRRRRGEGSVCKRKEGRWEASLYVSSLQGTVRKRKYAHTRTEAEAILVELRKKRDSGLKINSREARLGDYMEYWLLKTQPSVARSTFASYSSTVQLYLKPGLGDKYLTKLKPSDVKTFFDDQLNLGKSNRNLQKMRVVLSSVLQRACYEELINRNVARMVKTPTYRSKEVEPWDVNQLNTFLNHAADSEYYPIYFLMGFYGLRCGEALGISWSDIDIDNKVIRIHQQVECFNKTYSFKKLKTEDSRRKLPLVPATLNALENVTRTSEGPLSDLIFKSSNGLPIDPSNLRRTFRRLIKEVGLPAITPHHLRHTAATNLMILGTQPKAVQSILGHAHISTTMQIYQHANMSGKSEAFDRYERQIVELNGVSRQIKPSIEKAIA